jgi:hypothetical protein
MLAMFLTPIGRYLTIAAIAVLFIGGAYVRGRSDCKAMHAVANLRAENAVLIARLQTVENIAQADAERAIADTAEIERLKGLIDATPQNPNACGDDGLSRRLRGIH